MSDCWLSKKPHIIVIAIILTILESIYDRIRQPNQ